MEVRSKLEFQLKKRRLRPSETMYSKRLHVISSTRLQKAHSNAQPVSDGFL